MIILKDNNFKILVVDDQEEYRNVLRMILERKKYQVDTVESAETAINTLKENNYDIVITDLIMNGLDGIDLLRDIKLNKKDTEVIIITGYGSIENAVVAMKEGAFSYFIKSHNPKELIEEIEKVRQLNNLGKKINKNRNLKLGAEHILETNNRAYRKVLRIAEKAAKSNSNVLILGESGVGKEVIAKYIYKCSERKTSKFVDVNCHSFSETLLESELFGHEKGAFTGANEKRIGRFEVADGGVLFLDEIGNISMSAQSKILKAIENKKIERIGSNTPISVDFRLITATNKNLSEEISKEQFREDLFYRISTITIDVPPLRQRREDIEILVDFFINKFSIEMNKEITGIEDDVKLFLKNYNFPGNIRELKNIIERLIVLSEDSILRYCDLPLKANAYKDDVSIFDDEIIHLREIRKEAESNYIRKVLETCNYNVSESAKKLGISRRQLYNKITDYKLK